MSPTKQHHVLVLLLLLVCCYSISTAAKHNTTVPCLPDQASALLQLKRSFIHIDPKAFSSWRAGSDCCRWPLVACDMASGRVISLHLSEVNLKSLDPVLFNLSSLESLSLNTAGISKELSSLSKLQLLNELYLNGYDSEKVTLSGISYLQRLATLWLESYDFSRSGSSWIGNLSSLDSLLFVGCKFSGPIPYQIGNLANLTALDVEGCGSTRQQFPSWIGNLTKLESLGIQGCNFSDPIPSTIWNFTKLESVQIGHNNLAGKIPKSLFGLPALQVLYLGPSQLSGSLEDIPNPLSSPLSIIALVENQLTGTIPKSFYQLKHLEILYLASNTLSGIVELNSFWRMENLAHLDLSDNMLSVVVDEGDNNTSLSLSKIQDLYLESCNLTKLPGALRYLDKVQDLDLSNNKINGVIPSWIWDNWKDQLHMLDLSYNMFTSLERAPALFHAPNLALLDLSFNRLKGSIPIPISSLPWASLDYSNNKFSSIVPDFGNFVKNISYLNLSKNRLNGLVLSSICSVSELTILDLSYNNFTGMFPSCLIENEKLTLLKLRENKLQWIMPIKIKVGRKFQTIDLNGNQIEGKLPRSLSNCQDLELLDVGNNHIVGSFPSWLGILSHLRVLVLRSNQLNGTIRDKIGDHHISNHFPSLQILDLASNNFSGNLPKRWFNKLKAMTANGNDSRQVLEHLTNLRKGFYDDIVTLTFKGGELAFTKILTAFGAIDFSNNTFDGPIPESIGRLTSLHGLNLSYNNFTGKIPSQLGMLSQLESLDLSWNQLSEEIPQELSSLTYLEWLNLSNNNLTGRIPQGNQFSTFSNSSFDGNMGLCGLPLSRQCDTPASLAPNTVPPPESNSLWQNKLEAILLFAFVGLGFGIGFALSFLLRLFCHIEGSVCKPR